MKKTKKSLTSFAKKELDVIHGYSTSLNKLLKKNHTRVLLDLMQAHVKEIKQRYARGDKHFIIETGDLLILCFELIIEARHTPDIILSKCYRRYNKKLPELIRGLK